MSQRSLRVIHVYHRNWSVPKTSSPNPICCQPTLLVSLWRSHLVLFRGRIGSIQVSFTPKAARPSPSRCSSPDRCGRSKSRLLRSLPPSISTTCSGFLAFAIRSSLAVCASEERRQPGIPSADILRASYPPSRSRRLKTPCVAAAQQQDGHLPNRTENSFHNPRAYLP